MSLQKERLVGAAVGIAALALVTGCGTTSLENMWKDPQHTAAPIHSAMVIAVRKDPIRRRVWEDAFVTALAKAGVEATPSYRIFPDELPDSEVVREHVQQKGYDAVIVSSRTGTQEIAKYVPGYVTQEPVTVFRPLWGTYVTRYRDVYHPGYTETDQAVHVQTDVWITQGDGTLVWSGTSRTIDPQSAKQFSHEVTDLVVDELRKNHIVP